MIKTRNKLLAIIGILSYALFAVFIPSFAKEAKEPKMALTVNPHTKNFDVGVKAEISENSVTIGDKIKYTITVSADKNMEVEFPEFSKGLGSFAVKDFGSSKKLFFAKQKLAQWYILDTYTTGKTIIPKAQIKYRKKGQNDWKKIETDEKSIEVKSVLDKKGAKAPVMRDIKGPQSLPRKFLLLILAVVFIFISALIIIGICVLRKKSQKLPAKLRPAHEIAYQELGVLEQKDFVKQGKIKEYHIELSGIIRRYIENRFNLKAPEMTTEEFLIKARDAVELISAQKSSLREFLNACDLVKFAKYIPGEEEIAAVLLAARNFILQTKQEDAIL